MECDNVYRIYGLKCYAILMKDRLKIPYSEEKLKNLGKVFKLSD